MADVVSIWGAEPDSTARPTVSVVIPALNEAKNLPHVAARMPQDVDEIIVVDGNSVDATAEVARSLWPTGVHIVQTRRGKGNALACGFAAATGEIIVMLDADGSTDPAEIPDYVGALIAGADFAKGSRFVEGSANVPALRRGGNRVLSSLLNLLFSASYTDPCYGYNAFWRHCLDPMTLPELHASSPQWGDGFEIETIITVRVAARRLKIAEVRSCQNSRLDRGGNLNAVSDGLRVLRTIRKEFSRKPKKVASARRDHGAFGAVQVDGLTDNRGDEGSVALWGRAHG